MAINKWNNGKDSFAYEGHANLGVNLNRQKNAPLDISCEFSSIKDALYYVTEGRYPIGGTDVTSFVKDMKKYPYLGQVIAIVNTENEEVALYYIKTAAYDDTLTTDDAVFEHYFEEVGKATVGDSKSIVLSEDGVLSLYGIDGAATGAQLVMGADGKISWVVPSTETVEGLQIAVGSLQETVNGDADKGVTGLVDKVTTLENVVGDDSQGLVKDIADNAAAIEAINDESTGILIEAKKYVDGKVSGVFHFQGSAPDDQLSNIQNPKEGDVYTVGDKEYAYDGANWVELGFTTDLSAYSTTAQVTSLISTAKEEAISTASGDATIKANKALGDAKEYADGLAGNYAPASVTGRVDTTESEIDALQTLTNGFGEGVTVKAYVDDKNAAMDTRVKALETTSNSLGDLATKDNVAEADLATELATKINNKANASTVYDKDTMDTKLAGKEEKGAADAVKSELMGDADTADSIKGVQKAVSEAQSKADSAYDVASKAVIANTVITGATHTKITYDSKGLVTGGSDLVATDIPELAIEKITGLQAALDSKQGNIPANTYDSYGSASAVQSALIGTDEDASTAITIKGVQKAVNTVQTTANQAKETANVNAQDIAGIKNGTINNFAGIESALADKQPVGDYATKTEAQNYATNAANGKDTAIAEAKKAGTDAQADIDALETIVGDAEGGLVKAVADETQARIDADKTLQDNVDAVNEKIGAVIEGKTVVEMINDAKTAATYDDTQIKADIKTNTEAIGVLNGTGEGSVKKSVDDAINKFATDVTNDEVVNSYKELIDWVAEHGPEATEMAAAIDTLEAILVGIGGTDEKATVVAYVNEAIEALKIGDYAKVADLTALAERVAVLETNTHTHANKALLDTYTQTEENLADTVAKKHSHNNIDELNKIVAGDKAKWDAMEQNAKDYADKVGLDIIGEEANEASANTIYGAKKYADSLAINYDASGSAQTAEDNAKSYVDTKLTWGTF